MSPVFPPLPVAAAVPGESTPPGPQCARGASPGRSAGPKPKPTSQSSGNVPISTADIEAIRFGEAVGVVVGCAVADPDL